MKIEFGFQSNCSELGTHLGFTNHDEVVQALEMIEKVTGWTWGVALGDDLIPIPPGQMNQLLRITRPLPTSKVDPGSLGISWPESGSSGYRSPVRLLTLYLYAGPKDRLISKYTSGRYDRPVLRAQMGAELAGKGLFIAIEDPTARSLPPFHSIRRAFNSGYTNCTRTFDSVYATWMAYHFIDKEETKRYLRAKAKSQGKDEDEIQASVAWLEQYPPIGERTSLTVAEHELICSELLPRKIEG